MSCDCKARLAAMCLTIAPLMCVQAQDYNARVMLGTTPKFCNNNNPCRTTVLVSVGEPKDPSGCTASWPFNSYDVKKGAKPKLVWEIQTEAGDTNRYQFHPNDGVKLNSADMNDTGKDLFDQGHDSADGTKFRWRDKNKRIRDKTSAHPVPEERAIRFDFVVLRVSDGHPCAAGDPVIINRGQ